MTAVSQAGQLPAAPFVPAQEPFFDSGSLDAVERTETALEIDYLAGEIYITDSGGLWEVAHITIQVVT